MLVFGRRTALGLGLHWLSKCLKREGRSESGQDCELCLLDLMRNKRDCLHAFRQCRMLIRSQVQVSARLVDGLHKTSVIYRSCASEFKNYESEVLGAS